MELGSGEYLGFSADAHFANLPGFKTVEFDPVRATGLLEVAGFPEAAIPNSNVFVRPDYQSGYSPHERRRMFLRNPFYDSVAASSVRNDHGGVDITVVDGPGPDVNELLRYEARQGAQLLARPERAHARLKRIAVAAGAVSLVATAAVVGRAEHSYLPGGIAGGTFFLLICGKLHRDARKEKKEKAEALAFARDEMIRDQYGGIITIDKTRTFSD